MGDLVSKYQHLWNYSMENALYDILFTRWNVSET